MSFNFHKILSVVLVGFTANAIADFSETQQDPSAWLDLNSETAIGFEGEDPTLDETRRFLEAFKYKTDPWTTLFQTGTAAKLSWGVVFRGPQPYSLNPSTAMTPASLTKLFVSGALLQYKKSTDRIATRLSWSMSQSTIAQGLAIVGTGDPTWGEKDFGETLTTRADEVASILKSRGIKEVRGPILVRGSDVRWDTIKRPFGWKDKFGLQCGAALGQAINLQSNCARFVVTGPGSGKWMDAGVPVEVNVKANRGTRTSLVVTAKDTAQVDSYSYEITGSIASSANRTFYLPIHRTGDWFKNLVIEALQRAEIKFTPTSYESATGDREEATLYSPPLKDIFKPYLKDSINFFGDALVKHLASVILVGPKMTGGSMMNAGLDLIQNYTHDVGGDAIGSVFYDGSGLSYQNRVSASGLMAVLEHMLRDEEFLEFYNWLPIAGVDGTLKERMKGTAAFNRLRAKTGTLDKISNLAGYVPETDSAGRITGYTPFVILSGTLGYTTTSRTVQNKAGAALSALVKAP